MELEERIARAIADGPNPASDTFDKAAAVLAAIRETHAIVPREATREMLREGSAAAKLYEEQEGVLGVERQVWAVMIEAAEGNG